MVWVRGGFRVRVKVGDSFRVRDRASVRAEGLAGFYASYKATRFKASLWRRIRKKTKLCKKFFKIAPKNGQQMQLGAVKNPKMA